MKKQRQNRKLKKTGKEIKKTIKKGNISKKNQKKCNARKTTSNSVYCTKNKQTNRLGLQVCNGKKKTSDHTRAIGNHGSSFFSLDTPPPKNLVKPKEADNFSDSLINFESHRKLIIYVGSRGNSYIPHMCLLDSGCQTYK